MLSFKALSCVNATTRFSTVEQVFLWMVEVWSRHKADAQCTAGGREGAKGQDLFCLNFSCLATEYEFYFTS